ncbi:conserved hypothetical protein [Paecilomyces variotii No. 5]|uniref:Uncharacterized protein n=1 Tax=Byssochlamys spectabilis (strain No. 5 / NBRC 109023) TaxID=1356009 RepID=V5FPY5_BYSSN|nr:conserved hypothetical protein [Paecilomyces variotii No. 5]
MGLFGRHSTEKDVPPQRTEQHHNQEQRHSSLFSHRSSGSSSHAPAPASNSTNNGSNGRSLLHRNHEDPSIAAARERVAGAEAAEREADKALAAARQAVRDAREHVKRLEHEAAEEARLAKIKQDQARSISKRAKPLGRHENVV